MLSQTYNWLTDRKAIFSIQKASLTFEEMQNFRATYRVYHSQLYFFKGTLLLQKLSDF